MARGMRERQDGPDSMAPVGFVPASAEYSGPQAMSSAADVTPGSFEQYSRKTADYSGRKGRGGSRGVKVLVVLIIIALVAGLGAGGFYLYRESQKNAINENLHDISTEELEAIDNELTGMTTFDEPFTMLLLGSDERSGDPDMGARTDTIVLVRIDPVQNVVSMVSIPRDTMVQIPGVGTAKINAAYSYGGPSGTIAAVKDLCDVEIDHFAEINFEGLVGLIDAIGGIDVYVEETVDDPDAGDIVIPEGEQHLDGYASLVFSRSRAYADGDFTRVSNQRKVIEAIIHRGLEAPATELYGLVRASTSFLTTDSGMDVDFIYSLADQMRHNNEHPLTLYTATIPASTDMVNGLSYVIADDYGLAELMKVFLAGGDVSGGEADAQAEAEAQAGAASASASGSSSSTGSSAGASSRSASGDYEDLDDYDTTTPTPVITR